MASSGSGCGRCVSRAWCWRRTPARRRTTAAGGSWRLSSTRSKAGSCPVSILSAHSVSHREREREREKREREREKERREVEKEKREEREREGGRYWEIEREGGTEKREKVRDRERMKDT